MTDAARLLDEMVDGWGGMFNDFVTPEDMQELRDELHTLVAREVEQAFKEGRAWNRILVLEPEKLEALDEKAWLASTSRRRLNGDE